MTFECRRRRLHFRACDAIGFPATASNVLRGGVGTVLRETDGRAFAEVFSPRRSGGPSGLADPPRPFVFRGSHLDGRTVAPGAAFHYDLHLFDLRDATARSVEAALAELARRGFGTGRGRAALERVEELAAPRIDLGVPEIASAVNIRFLTPTELKTAEGLAAEPAFAVLFARLRDRISTLRALYGPGPLPIDFRGLAERAVAVTMVRSSLQRVRAERRSTRTGQAHPLGGFTGEAQYEGKLDEFMPYLRAGDWCGVGRQTVWGKGAFEIAILR